MIFLVGGARSGKSSLAVSMAKELDRPVRFVATARADGDEMSERIERHRRSRPVGWTVIEAPTQVTEEVHRGADGETIVLDCVTLWVSNLMVELDDDTILAEVDASIEALRRHSGHVIVVSNEVGSGIVPMHPVGRRFRDLQGTANKRFAAASDVAYLVVAGKMLRLGDVDDVG